jgi:hypothetical protein
MCDPVTITFVALTVAAGVTTAYGQIYQGQAANAAAKHEALVADRNAKLTEAAKVDAAKRGEREQLNHWRRVSQLMGDQRAQVAANNLDVNFGTPAEVVENTMLIGVEDSLLLATNTKKEVEGLDIEQANYRETSVAARARGKAALAAGKIGAVGTLLGTAAQVAGKFTPSPGAGGGGGDAARFTGRPTASGFSSNPYSNPVVASQGYSSYSMGRLN